MSILERMRLALDRSKLEDLILELKAEGISQREIYDHLGKLILELRDQKREQEEDCVLDVSDRVWGWCNPKYSFFETTLSN